MSFDKFKNIKTTVSIETDANYSKTLASLPESKNKGSVIKIVLSVAAAFMLVAAVSLWMLIGGAIRNQGEHIAGTPDNDGDAYPMTEELKTDLIFLYHERYLVILPEFDNDNPLTVEQVLNYCEFTGAAYDADLTLTREEFSEYAKNTFGYSMTLSEDKNYDTYKNNSVSYNTPDPIAFTLKNGVATVEYILDDCKAVLRIACNSVEPLEFGRFVSFKKEDIEVKPEGLSLAQKQEALSFWTEHGLSTLAEFDKKNPLSVEEITENIETAEFEITSDRIITKQEFSEFAKARFGYDMTIEEDIKLGHVVKYSTVGWEYPPLTDYRVNGDAITMTYSGGGMSYTLTQEKGIITSFKKERTNKYKSVKAAFDEIAKEYRFDVIPEKEEHHLLGFEQKAQYVANVIGETKIYINSIGVKAHGIPQDQFIDIAHNLFQGGYGSDDGHFTFDNATEADYGIANCLGNEFFVPVKEPAPMGEVKYKSSKVEDHVGYKRVSVTFTTQKGECTVVYRSLDGIMPIKIESCVRKEDQDGKEKSLEEMMVEIANKYNFDAIHAFEEDTTPDYMRYHISQLYKKCVKLENGKGGWFYGMPLDDYKELAIKYYGKNDMEGKVPIDFEEQMGYIKYADLIKTDAGIYVCIEAGDAFYNEFVCTDVQYGKTKSGEDCITATFNEYFMGYDDVAPTVRTVCFTVEGEMTPKQFISCTIATSEPIK